MSSYYLDPEDVGPEHARQVLDFLNAAQSPEEIARRVEIAGEPDIGERLASRILARRQELGGFANLRQLADIPLIGPERFTEIVVTLSGARPIIRVEPTIAELMAELTHLRGQIAGLEGTFGAPSRVSIQSLQAQPYLGEGINIVVQVTNASATRPLVDAPVTLVTTWGRLRAVDGTRFREGTSLVTRTDDVGMARALLYPPTSEELLPSQQAALQAALRHLPRNAAIPRDADSGLREIARQYRWHGNPDLRSAIDIYFRDFGKGLLESVNNRDYLASWIFQEATVLAMVGGAGATEIGAANANGNGSGPDGNGNGSSLAQSISRSSVEVTGALTLRVRNWLGAWVEVLQEISDEEARLTADLRDAALTGEAGALLSRVYLRLNDYVTEQRGVVGGFVGQRLAERSLRDFLETGIAELPTTLQRAVLPSLQVASRTVTTAGTHVLAAVGQTRTELKREIDSRQVDTGIFDELNVRISDLDSRMARKVDVESFDSFRGDLTNQLAAKVDQSSFSSFQQQVDTRFASKVDQTAFSSFQQQVDTRFASKVDQTVFADFRQQLELDLGGLVTRDQFAGFEAQVATDLGRKVDQTTFADFRTSVELDLGRKVDGVVFEGFRDSTVAGLSGKLETAEFTAFTTSVQSELRGVVREDALAAFQTALEADLANKTDLALFNGLQESVTAELGQKVDTTALSGLRQDLTRALDGKVDATVFSGFQQTLGADLARKADVAALDGVRRDLGLAIEGFNLVLEEKADRSTVGELETRLSAELAAKLDVGTFNGFQQTVSTELAGRAGLNDLANVQQQLTTAINGKVGTAQFADFERRIDGQLRDKADRNALTTLETRLANVDGEVTRLQSNSLQLDQQLSNINVSLNKIDQDVTTLRLRR